MDSQVFSKSPYFLNTPRINEINYHDLPCDLVKGINLPYVSEERNLGVWMMNNLSWNRHVSCISRKVHGTLHALKYLSEETRIKLVTALLFTNIDFCCLVYHGLTDDLDKKLQKLVNLEIRFIYNLKRGEHITVRYRLTVRYRRLHFLGILAYRVRHRTVPSYIAELFCAPSTVLRHSERLPDHNTLFLFETLFACRLPTSGIHYLARSFRHLVLVYLGISCIVTCAIARSRCREYPRIELILCLFSSLSLLLLLLFSIYI